MKKKFLSIYALGALTLFSACKKWVDVQPNDRLVEDKVFTDPENIRSAINGIYSNVASRELYGQFMTMTAMDALGQLNSGAVLNVGGGVEAGQGGTLARPYADYTYEDPLAKTGMSTAWSASFKTILNINHFLASIDKYPGVLPAAEETLYRGELHALRAMLHFDMLRLFGPVYITDSTALAVPYYTTSLPNVKPLLRANEAMDSVMTDMDRAIAFLANDPVLTKGKEDKIENDGMDYSRMRNLRMNIYAAKALKARMLLYRNDKPAAYALAQELIGVLDKDFPWFDPVKGRSPVDRTFSQEVLFAVNAPNLYDWTRTLFGGDVDAQQMWAPNSTRLASTYENQVTTDFRFSNIFAFSWWEVPSGGTISYRTLRKFNDVDGATVQFRYRVPMLRKSEVYYIAAECAPDDAAGFDYLNQVRAKRGLLEAPATTVLQTEIGKEYAKEMYGEGQLFFYYKRTNTPRLLKSSTVGTTNANYVTMTRAQYVVPLPDDEAYFQ
ncbi:RagB/SusD family nutrient uptake outer membrane protein [Chitinophaga sp.]|uniref:RagB/SusD family nutrient uptake outer membrane protein n=1 Tax=Chitinophaga sp. TaxID=1869181 RepID=UPI0026144064|nr:RagB/SusD family nutrient uptake outer membrane protein [uncultured Chitinophaga sp.]